MIKLNAVNELVEKASKAVRNYLNDGWVLIPDNTSRSHAILTVIIGKGDKRKAVAIRTDSTKTNNASTSRETLVFSIFHNVTPYTLHCKFEGEEIIDEFYDIHGWSGEIYTDSLEDISEIERKRAKRNKYSWEQEMENYVEYKEVDEVTRGLIWKLMKRYGYAGSKKNIHSFRLHGGTLEFRVFRSNDRISFRHHTLGV